MAQLGADVEQLELLGRKFEEEAQKIETTVSTIASQVEATWWQGSDAAQFRNEWQTTYMTNLRQVVQHLQQAGSACRTQATQQRQVSQA